MPPLKYVEQDERGLPTGRTIEFDDAEFEPLGFKDLTPLKATQPVTIKLKGRGMPKVLPALTEADEAGRANFSMTLQSHFAASAIGLVKGGWLPSSLAVHADTIVFPDRCIFAQIEGRFASKKPRSVVQPDFLDLFADSTVRINPMLFVMEGNMRRMPTEMEARSQLTAAVTKLRSALPKAILISATEAGLKGALGLLAEATVNLEQKQDFLIEVAPVLSAPIAKRSISKVWSEIISAARSRGLRPGSLTVLAALSTVLMPQGKSPARKLCKFSRNYSRDDAYNVLADLRSLEMLVQLFAVFPEQRAMLCTADRALALFWTGLRPFAFGHQNGTVSFEFDPTVLLPNMTEEQRATLNES
ncbi:hypothetical protein [Bradyrhizobium sp. USDA 3650]